MKRLDNDFIFHFLFLFIFFLIMICTLRIVFAEDYIIEDRTRREKIEQFIDYMNDEAYKFLPGDIKFECNNVDAIYPILDIICKTCTRHTLCDNCKKGGEQLAISFSISWNLLTESKMVNIFNQYDEKVFYVDEEGCFFIVKDYL